MFQGDNTYIDAFLQFIDASSKPQKDRQSAARKQCKLRILYVDDEPDSLDVTKQILELEGNFKVVGAFSVDEAFKKMETNAYDIIVSDYEMPKKNGLEFLIELRQLGNTTPFIIFTGRGREEVVVRALNLGAFRYINKYGETKTIYKELSTSIRHACEHHQAREDLLRSEENFRQLFSNMPSGVAVYEAIEGGKDFIFVDFNRTAEKIDKTRKKDLIGKRITETFPGVREFGLFEVLQRVWQTGKPEYFPATMYNDHRQQGVWRENWIYKLPNGNIVAIYNDITERKKSEAGLKKSEERFRELANSLPEVVFELDPNGKMIYVNKRGFELTGYTEKDFTKGINVFDLLTPADLERAKVDTKSVLLGAGPPRGEFLVRKKNGDVFPVAIESVPLVSDGKTVGLRGIAIDLTKSHKKEKEIQNKAKEVNRIIDGVGDLLFVMDSNRRIVRVNKSFCDAFKKKPQDLVGKHCYEVVHGTNKPWPNCPATRTFEEKTTASEEVIDPHVGKPLLVTTSPILDEKGELMQCVHTAKDITAQKNIEAQLQNSLLEAKNQEEKIAALLEGTHAVLIKSDFPKAARAIFDACKKITRATAGYVALLSEYGAENKVLFLDSGGLKCNVNPSLPMPIRGLRERAYRTKKSVYENDFSNTNWMGFLPKGHVKLANVMFVPLVVDNKAVGLMGLANKPEGFTDEDSSIAEAFGRYAAIALNNSWSWEAIKNKEAQLRAITNSAIDAIIVLGNEGEIVFWSPAAEKTFGYTTNEVVGKNLHNILSPEQFHVDYEKGFAKFAKTGQGKAVGQTLELSGLRKDGSEFPIELALSALQLNGKWHALGIVRDISERKKAEKELRDNRDQVKRVNEKLRVVGGLTRHDVLNKLCIVTGNSFLLKSKHAAQPELVDKLNSMEHAVRDIKEIFEFARIYEQLGAEKLSLISVSRAINEAKGLFPESVNLEIVDECQGLSLLADSLLRQLFYNLIDNSVKHGMSTTKIRVHFEKNADAQLDIIYEDNGKGISTANKVKLFKEGFSTRGSSGYGLYLIKKMMEVYGWDIQEVGEPEKGAKFVIKIPLINQQSGKKNYHITS